MAKSEPTTKPTGVDPAAFIAAVDHPERRADGEALLALYRDVTGLEPVVWGSAMVGFGRYHYETKSCAGDWPRAAFSARKAGVSLYFMEGYKNPETEPGMAALRARLGKHKVGASCVTVNKLADVDMSVLRDMIALDLAWMDKNYPR